MQIVTLKIVILRHDSGPALRESSADLWPRI